MAIRTFVIPDTSNSDRSYFVGECLDVDCGDGGVSQKVTVVEVREEGDDLVLVCETVQ